MIETASCTATPPRLTVRHRPAGDSPLTTSRGAALYIGALLGPGLLLLPGLAAAAAGPASILAWVGLLALSGLFAIVFAALGRGYPSAGGVLGYVAAGLGPRTGLAAGWSFLSGVVSGAPVVCLIGASYVTGLTGGGRVVRAGIAALLLVVVLALAARGLRASAGAQLLLVGLLIAVVVVAVTGSAGSAHAANWTPFAPHGWLAVGHAAATLMLSFVGWEAVAPLTTRFADPSRQLARVVAIALAVTAVLYLGLAIATIGVLGSGASTLVPLAALLGRVLGPAGAAVAAVAAVVLTLGTTNAYINGAAVMADQMTRPRLARTGGQQGGGHGAGGDAGDGRPSPRFLAAIAVSGLLLITLYGLGVVSPASLVAIPTTLFLAVYLGSMVAAARVLRGPARWAAIPAAGAVVVMLGYCGWALAAPVLVFGFVTVTRSFSRLRGMSDPRRNVAGMNLPKRHSGRRRDRACPDCAKEEAGLDADRLAYMNWITTQIGEHGWAVSGIYGDNHAPPWAYSVGMWLTCQSAELIVCGVPVQNAAGIINAIGSRIADGEEIGPDDVLRDICPAPLTVRPVDLSWRTTSLFGLSDQFYGFVRPPYLQVVWADRDGRFPWEPGFHRGFLGKQPLLWLPRDDNPPSPWTRIDLPA